MARKLQLVIFNIGKEAYGVTISAVQEIVRVPEVTEVPEVPAFFQGVINLRGGIIPVIDLRRRLRLEPKELSRSSRVLIAEYEGSTKGRVGLLVDSVSEVIKIEAESVEEPPEMVSAVGIQYITGVAKLDQGLIVLLDLDKILSLEDMRTEFAAAGQELTRNVA